MLCIVCNYNFDKVCYELYCEAIFTVLNFKYK